MTQLYNHLIPSVSKLEKRMISHISPGGNWKDIPKTIPSQRLKQIRKSGGRTTYYGRLKWDAPSYTISTYFNRLGNGCHIHPSYDRIISIREGARLQSFPDKYRFYGSKGSIYKQIGNAVPPLLAYAVLKVIGKFYKIKHFIDLFAGAGGMSEGLRMAGSKPIGSIELERPYFDTYINNLRTSISKEMFICGDITEKHNQKKLVDASSVTQDCFIVGGPPCQGFSLAGLFKKDDPRNKLFKEYIKIVSKVSPKFFIFENVPGLLSMDSGKYVEKIISEFEAIGYRIDKPWKLMATDYGVPQKRKRIFLVGHTSGKIEPPKAYLDENSHVTVRDAIYGLPKRKPGNKDDVIKYNKKSNSNYQKFITGEISVNAFIKKQKTCRSH